MITIKDRDYTFLAISINLHDEGDGTASLWATMPTGNSRKMISGPYENMKEYRLAIEWSISERKPIFELD
jgi:hypothetical protein